MLFKNSYTIKDSYTTKNKAVLIENNIVCVAMCP